jgi:hypothetical protein
MIISKPLNIQTLKLTDNFPPLRRKLSKKLTAAWKSVRFGAVLKLTTLFYSPPLRSSRPTSALSQDIKSGKVHQEAAFLITSLSPNQADLYYFGFIAFRKFTSQMFVTALTSPWSERILP